MAFVQFSVAMVTPFDQQERLDEAGARGLIDHLIADGVEGIILTGTTGEAHLLSTEEKCELYRIAVDQVQGRVQVVAGVGTTSTRETMKLAQAAEAIGVDGLMVGMPPYVRPSQEELQDHCEAVVEAVQLPVMLYNNPGRTCVDLSVGSILQLAKLPNVKGIKEGADLVKMARLRRELPSDVGVYVGSDNLLLPVLAMGMDGITSMAGNVMARPLKKVVDLLNENDLLEARSLFQKLLPVIDSLFVASTPVSLKYAMQERGLTSGVTRGPLARMNEAQCLLVKQQLGKLEEMGWLL